MSKATTAATKEQLIELIQYLSQNISVPTIGIGGGFAPIGTIISYMGTTAPQDYLICDGTTYNIADYKQLSDFFAAQFGSANFFGGDGVTTFKVPDLRGEFLRGTGINSHTDQGRGANVGVHQDATEIPKIFVNSENNTMGSPNVSTTFLEMTKVDSDLRKNVSGKGKQAALSYEWDSTSYNVATTRPTNTSVLYCIKAVAAGDVYSTEERVVGTWIDGKHIYQKTIVDTMPTVTTEGTEVKKSIDISSLSVESAVDVKIMRKWQSKYYGVMNDGYEKNGTTCYCRHFLDVLNHIFYVQTNTTLYSGCDIYITLRYTKTTD